jgi:hypothetical protein
MKAIMLAAAVAIAGPAVAHAKQWWVANGSTATCMIPPDDVPANPGRRRAIHRPWEAVAMYECGDRKPAGKTFWKLAKALSCKPSWLEGLNNDLKPPAASVR